MKKVTSILFLILLCLPVYSQDNGAVQKSDTIKIYFDRNSHAINFDLSQNKESISRLSDLIDKIQSDTLSVITKVEINSYASPEGERRLNKKLTEQRSNSIYDYIAEATSVPDSLIVKNFSGADWAGLQQLVEESDMQYKDEVLHILKSVPEETWRRVKPDDRWLTLVDSRNKHLLDLKNGNPYNYMFANFYPQLRNGSVVTLYFEQIAAPEPKEEVAEPVKVAPEPEPEPEPLPVAEVKPEPVIKPLLALKTNLLFDAATLLNVEVEVPIGKRWSIAGEWIFPWWSSCGNRNNSWQSGESSRRNTVQILNGNLEGKYWFGDRTNRPVLTGWHMGVYVGGGLYDLEHKAEGYQGESFIAAGLSGGYAHTINKMGNLRMEYSLGVGYLQTHYRHYQEHWGNDNTWHTIRQNNGTFRWIGPTRARVSLVWMLNRKVNKEK